MGLSVKVYKLIIGYELAAFIFKHFYKVVKTLNHFTSAVIFDDEWHLELGMVLKLIKLPWMEICHEIAVAFKDPANQ